MEMDKVSETGIREQVIVEICEIAKRCQVDKVLLFGSRARGDFKRTSDIDLAVTGGGFSEICIGCGGRDIDSP